jgi:cytochrome P450
VFGVQEPARGAALEAALLSIMDAVWPPSIMIRWLQRDLGPFTPWRRFVRARERADALIYAEIAARRARPRRGHPEPSCSRPATRTASRHERRRSSATSCRPCSFAGHETTAIALAWAMYWLHRDPDTLERLRAELATLGDEPDLDAIAQLPYLDAVCNETLRLYPIVPLAPRTLRQPMTLGDHEIPARRARRRRTVLVHRHPALYPEPDAFRPERWLARKFAAWEFTPFGGGTAAASAPHSRSTR